MAVLQCISIEMDNSTIHQAAGQALFAVSTPIGARSCSIHRSPNPGNCEASSFVNPPQPGPGAVQATRNRQAGSFVNGAAKSMNFVATVH